MNEIESTKGLLAYRAGQSQLKLHQVRESLEALQERGEPLSIAAVARDASVSRQFIHSHPELARAIRQAIAQQSTVRPKHSDTARVSAVEQGLRADRSALIARVEQMKTELLSQADVIADLQVQRRRWLGSQLTHSIDPEQHLELRVENSRLTAQTLGLTREVANLQRMIAGLEDDLAASRTAHADSVRELTAGTGIAHIGSSRVQ